MISKSEAWKIYHNSPQSLSKKDKESWLLLDGCPHCGEFQTRATYVRGFWKQVIELVTDYSCCGIYQCKCGGWSNWAH
jgi:hypothetical protein